MKTLVGKAGDTTSADEASGNAGVTSGGIVDITTSAPSGNAGDTQTSLPVPADKPTYGVRRDDDLPAAPAPPPPALGGPDGGAAARGPKKAPTSPFDELWSAYGLKKDRAKAKAAYEKLAPDAGLHAEIVAAATAWRAAYDEAGREPKFRTRLQNWIAGEKWLEDLPEPYVDRKAEAIAKRRERGAAKQERAPERGNFHTFPPGTHVATVVEATDENDGGSWSEWNWVHAVVTFALADGQMAKHTMVYFDVNDLHAQETGSRAFKNLCAAAGLIDVDVSKLVGAVVSVTAADDGVLIYAPAPAATIPVRPCWTTLPAGTSALVRVVGSEIDEGDERVAVFGIKALDGPHAGGVFDLHFVIKSDDTATVEYGKGALRLLAWAAHVASLTDTDDLHGAIVRITVTDEGVAFAPAPDEAASLHVAEHCNVVATSPATSTTSALVDSTAGAL